LHLPERHPVGRAVATAAREFSAWGWVFREQAALDVGIDALAEEGHDGFLTGRLIALVFKAGQAFFAFERAAANIETRVRFLLRLITQPQEAG
jgi:hypothetical protein